MPSFSQIAAFSTLALAAFAAAAPVAAPKRQAATLNDVLTATLAKLTPLTSSLCTRLLPFLPLFRSSLTQSAPASLTSANATAGVVGPLTQQISTIVNGAVSQVSALASQPIDAVLATADGVLDASDAAQLLAPVINTLIGALNDALGVAQLAGVTAVIQPLLDDVSATVAPLLNVVAPLVNGVLAATAPLLSPALATLNDLDLGSVVDLVESVL
ncbi:hypothetical protein GGX14DRAFT_623147 [Mycena pura]|uniref:Uncharacterized protein n=1 Tax=Mycena pura TaxID=153505 RepID=A0AAD6VJQ3_9AGAR|nr:hypothetical protein GGX14DRAFT_623147 [Mycena pura]